MSFLSKIFGDPNDRYIKSLEPMVAQINAAENEFQALSDADLKAKTQEFRKQLAEGSALDDLLPEAFAAVREASRRVSGKRHFDVQLMGGMVLHQGKIAQMRTGEGKTLTATLPVYLNALTGQGVHVVTVNDYLSRRDAAWMGQIYHALGLTIGVISHDSSYRYDPTHESPSDPLDKERDIEGGFRIVHEFLKPCKRRDAYEADITYGTNNEFGFDYLRDNMVYENATMAQRPESTHTFAIVDEVDSILIDEARTPLIISAPDEESGKQYETFARVVPQLKAEEDYTVDEKLKAVSITESGIEKVEKRLGIDNIYAEGGVRYAHHLEQALKAEVMFKRDRDYVVKDNEIIIVDEFTGRLMPGRRWSDGLHQAVEAKEGVKIQRESRTMATITFQNYFRLYKKLAGMTGTARTSAEEFHKVYKLDVIEVPTHRPMIREDFPDRIYKTQQGKLKAIVAEVKERTNRGQPVLIGTVSIEKNELLSAMLEREGVKHSILNAKNHEREAEIIAQAGQYGGATVATNMAGRGVDIILGGNPPDADEATKVKAAQGLHVIGTERHEARRIDDQLRGRAGRQGDPGSSQFFVSTEDDLARVFGGDRLKSLMDRLGVTDDDVIENSLVSRSIQQAQSRIEGHHFDARKYVLEYDDVMNKHREAVYGLRRRILNQEDTRALILDYLHEAVTMGVSLHLQTESGGPDLSAIAAYLKTLAPFGDDLPAKLEELTDGHDQGAGMIEWATGEGTRLYDVRENEITADRMRLLEKMVLLRTIDTAWVGHIEDMEYLRDSVRLRAYGQRDPLVEYKVEGQRLFDQLLHSIRAQVANAIFKVNFVEEPRVVRGHEELRDITGSKSLAQKDSESAGQEIHPQQNSDKIGRNDPCPCGSGKKYKKCHGI